MLARMKNFTILSLLFFASWNLAAMRGNVIAQLRATPVGNQIELRHLSWQIKENSLYGNKRTGKAVLLHNTQFCGKAVYEAQYTIEIESCQCSDKYNIQSTLVGGNTRWGTLIDGVYFALIGASLATLYTLGRS